MGKSKNDFTKIRQNDEPNYKDYLYTQFKNK